eukprot:TRINITY_DN3487_c0_g1_i1.p1 TRINITY_DN3487_c0_g1~~TRINITY_DN3487_c0_g1_i1.p1  ORF type:complete len:411 (-),score=143.88 TRINITY_DN3487_c0_g1_i1:133-1365(-)
MEGKKATRVWKEEIPDYVIDMGKVKYKKRRKLTDDGSVVKMFVEEGKGSEAAYGATVYYSIEARYKDGTLCNPRADRKGTNKMVLKGEDENKAFEIALAKCKFGESFWCKFTRKLLQSLRFYKELPFTDAPEGCDTSEIWCKFSVLKIKHAPKKIFFDFASLTSCLEESKSVAKEYIELAKLDDDLYDYALELYKFWINTLKQLSKQVKKDMTPEDIRKKDDMIVALHLNTAFIQLKREQYILAKEAAEAALELDPKNIKGAFRLAQACIKNASLNEKTYDCLKYCFEKEPENPAFAEYRDWYLKHKQKKEDKKAKNSQWRVYTKLLEEEKLRKKKKRKRERLGKEEEEEEEVKDEPYQDFNFFNDKLDGVAKEWEDAIREEEEERRAKKELEAQIENKNQQTKGEKEGN